ncbi:outer membrane protein assembly factor BamE [Legionella tunisiensis]|uniref:outer membrane protein assembly factor BamE n=1 Tax=Legionella tunisiensis TaxID=1034944 RepID=UPI0002FC6598|nr:outer membrane protein assembly factor BamE [Legionella tunisiensis]
MAKFFTTGKKMRIRTILISIALTLTLTHCTDYDFSRRIVQQGNLLPQSKIERLRLGMSKHDVAILMGTSLLSPTFNNERWDYAYTWRKGGNAMRVRNLSLYFSHGVLSRIEHHP